MAKYTRKRLEEKDIKVVLGETWHTDTQNGRPIARTNYFDRDFLFRECCTNLYAMDDDDYVYVQGADDVVVQDRPIWPKNWKTEIDLANFYVDEAGHYQHPLKGMKITELVKETHYPFHNSDQVTVILAYYYNEILSLNHPTPNVAVFVDTWSHSDERMQSLEANGTCSIFNIAICSELIDRQRAEYASDSIGKNFIIVPFGFDYDARSDEKNFADVHEKSVKKWKEIIQRFLNGETSPEGATNDTNSPENALSIIDNAATVAALSIIDNAATVAAKADYFAEFQKNLAEKYRDEFLSMTNVSKAAEHEAYLGEAEDKNGVLLYTVATEFESVDALRHYETINGVSYLVQRYNYCQTHLEKLESDLIDLMAHEK